MAPAATSTGRGTVLALGMLGSLAGVTRLLATTGLDTTGRHACQLTGMEGNTYMANLV